MLAPLIQLDFEDFPVVMHPFVVPEKTVWYRAAPNSEATLSNVPRFFGSYRTSAFYAEMPGRTLKAYSSIRALRLLDMRHVQCMMRMMVASRRTSQVSAPAHTAMELLNVALGLCSFSTQTNILLSMQKNALHPASIEPGIKRMLDFAKNVAQRMQQAPRSFPTWMNYIEAGGVRIGITDIDYMVMDVLKKLFEGIVDGILAPVMRSPFHDQGKMFEELVLFHPEEVLTELTALPQSPRLLLSAYLRDHYNAVLHADEHMEMPLSHARITQRGGRQLDSSKAWQAWQALVERDSLVNAQNPKNKRHLQALFGWIAHVHETFPFFFQYNPVISHYVSPYKKLVKPSPNATRVGYLGYGLREGGVIPNAAEGTTHRVGYYA